MNRLAVCAAVTASAIALSAGQAATAGPSPGRHGQAARHHAPAKPASESARLARSVSASLEFCRRRHSVLNAKGRCQLVG